MPQTWTAEFSGEIPPRTEVEFTPLDEAWSEYEIDGGKVRFRMILNRVWHVLDEEGRPVVEGGERVFRANFSIVVVDAAASELAIEDDAE